MELSGAILLAGGPEGSGNTQARRVLFVRPRSGRVTFLTALGVVFGIFLVGNFLTYTFLYCLVKAAVWVNRKSKRRRT